MERSFNLIKTEFAMQEKRVLPRYPFCFLTFRCLGDEGSHTFEVKDISFSGMQIALKNGEHGLAIDNDIEGILQWQGEKIQLHGTIKWVTEKRLGVEFAKDSQIEQSIRNLLSIDRIIAGMKPLHDKTFGLELPSHLKYWLRSDGPVEVFVWQHKDGEFSKFQIIMMENFIEWRDGEGPRSGRALSKRNIETPLILEDEYLFHIDETIDESKILWAQDLVKAIPDRLMPARAINFLKLKLGNK